MTGTQLVKGALGNQPRLVAVLATGYADFSAVREELPAVSVLRKPFEPRQLVEAVDAAINAHRLQTKEH